MKFKENHVLPTVRMQKIVMDGFKSVHHGDIVFNCGRKVVPQDTEADILGIYGQNGSGKTSVIEAIAILSQVMSGQAVAERYSECVSDGVDYAKLTFVFDLQYPSENGFTRTVTYSFKMKAIANEKYEAKKTYTGTLPSLSSFYPKKVRIFDEVVSAAGMFEGVNQIKQDIITTNTRSFPIGPSRKINCFVGDDKDDVVVDLAVSKKTAAKESKSFIFSKDTMELFYEHSMYSEYYQVLMELNYYALFYLYAVDTRASGIGATMAIPFNTRKGILPLGIMDTTRLSQRMFEDLEYFVKGINTVLPALVTDMELVIHSNDFVINKKTGYEVELFSRRKDTLIPLRDESAGIIKLISILSIIIAAYNDRSITVAIDELDAGIYEYLLGEILDGLQAYGKGQFIFTSHNLRPLEVLKKESLIFTTSNPDNRYIRLKGVGRTNNLRNLYLREILGNTQDEQIYDAAKRQRMIAAFMKAGVGLDEEK